MIGFHQYTSENNVKNAGNQNFNNGNQNNNNRVRPIRGFGKARPRDWYRTSLGTFFCVQVFGAFPGLFDLT